MEDKAHVDIDHKSSINNAPKNDAVKAENEISPKQEAKELKGDGIEEKDEDMTSIEKDKKSQLEKSMLMKEFKQLRADPVKYISEKVELEKLVRLNQKFVITTTCFSGYSVGRQLGTTKTWYNGNLV